MALGFYEETRNGHRIIGHAGDTQYFHSDLHLIPDAGLGFFISYNSAGKGETRARESVWHAFLDRYFPYDPPAATVQPNAAADASLVSGRYLISRRSETTILKVSTVLGETKVASAPDGTITVDSLKDPNGQPKKLEEIGPLMFRAVHGQDRVGFKRDESGRLVLVTDFPVFVFQRSPWNEDSALNLLGAEGSFVAINNRVSQSVPHLHVHVVPRRRKDGLRGFFWPRGKYRDESDIQVTAEDLNWDYANMLVDVLPDLRNQYAHGSTDLHNLALRTIQIVGGLGVLGTLAAVYNAFLSWRARERWFWSKPADTVVALACVAFVWFVFSWNMLYWSLRY